MKSAHFPGRLFGNAVPPLLSLGKSRHLRCYPLAPHQGEIGSRQPNPTSPLAIIADLIDLLETAKTGVVFVSMRGNGTDYAYCPTLIVAQKRQDALPASSRTTRVMRTRRFRLTGVGVAYHCVFGPIEGLFPDILEQVSYSHAHPRRPSCDCRPGGQLSGGE